MSMVIVVERLLLRSIEDQLVKSFLIFFPESMRVVKGEMATRTSFQRSAKGNVSIAECQPDGKFIILENTHRSKVRFCVRFNYISSCFLT